MEAAVASLGARFPGRGFVIISCPVDEGDGSEHLIIHSVLKDDETERLLEDVAASGVLTRKREEDDVVRH